MEGMVESSGAGGAESAAACGGGGSGGGGGGAAAAAAAAAGEAPASAAAVTALMRELDAERAFRVCACARVSNVHPHPYVGYQVYDRWGGATPCEPPYTFCDTRFEDMQAALHARVAAWRRIMALVKTLEDAELAATRTDISACAAAFTLDARICLMKIEVDGSRGVWGWPLLQFPASAAARGMLDIAAWAYLGGYVSKSVIKCAQIGGVRIFPIDTIFLALSLHDSRLLIALEAPRFTCECYDLATGTELLKKALAHCDNTANKIPPYPPAWRNVTDIVDCMDDAARADASVAAMIAPALATFIGGTTLPWIAQYARAGLFGYGDNAIVVHGLATIAWALERGFITLPALQAADTSGVFTTDVLKFTSAQPLSL